MRWKPEFLLGGAAFVFLLIFSTSLAWGETLSDRERTGLELQVELNRLGASGDPIEREALLRRMIDECQGTEAAEAAYWFLSDLYLDAFPDPGVKEAREVLELFLKQYPHSSWAAQAKCRLFTLYEGTDARSSQLKRELLADGGLPQIMKAFLKDGAASPPRLVLHPAPKKSAEPQKAKLSKKSSPAQKAPAKKAAPAKKNAKGTVKKTVTRKKR